MTDTPHYPCMDGFDAYAIQYISSKVFSAAGNFIYMRPLLDLLG